MGAGASGGDGGARAAEVALRLARAQKMAALGRLARGIAHDLGNILAAIEGQARFLARDLGPPEARRDGAHTILQAADQAQALIARIRAFARDADAASAAFDLRDPVRATLVLLRASVPAGVEVAEDIAGGEMTARGSASQMGQVALNLALNARDAMGGAGRLSVALAPVRAEAAWGRDGLLDALPDPAGLFPIRIEAPAPGRACLTLGALARGVGYARLSVADTGCGIPLEDMERVFEPFFTTKAADKGTGLGLSTVHGVVTAHRGALTIDSIAGRGTRFEVYIPLEAPV
jgi:signal transduction histidine kinase